MGDRDGASEAHAERACRDAINERFNLTGVKVYKITENTSGYTVRASGILRNGGSARLVCLASPNGTVRDVTIEHH